MKFCARLALLLALVAIAVGAAEVMRSAVAEP